MTVARRRFVPEFGAQALLVAAVLFLVAPMFGAWGGPLVGSTGRSWLAAATEGATLTTGMCTVAAMVLVGASNSAGAVTDGIIRARRAGQIVTIAVMAVAVVGVIAALTSTDLPLATRLAAVAIRLSSATAAAVAFAIASDPGERLQPGGQWARRKRWVSRRRGCG